MPNADRCPVVLVTLIAPEDTSRPCSERISIWPVPGCWRTVIGALVSGTAIVQFSPTVVPVPEGVWRLPVPSTLQTAGHRLNGSRSGDRNRQVCVWLS